jgi:biopolymer transport protein TolR
MAQIGGDDSGPNVTVELNLVPFIDLMSVCIIFLLITAVWSQVSMIQLGSSIYAKATEDGQITPPPRADVILRVEVREDGYRLHLGKNTFQFPRLPGGVFDQPKLFESLRGVKEQYPDKSDAMVTIADSLSYEEMIRVMDSLINAGFPEVAVVPGEGL